MKPNLQKKTPLMTATSENDGSFSFEKVPYGNWLVREIEQPEGFVLDETSYEVKISEVSQVIEVEIVNEYVHGNIKLTKVDEDYPDNKLTGATFEVYKGCKRRWQTGRRRRAYRYAYRKPLPVFTR